MSRRGERRRDVRREADAVERRPRIGEVDPVQPAGERRAIDPERQLDDPRRAQAGGEPRQGRRLGAPDERAQQRRQRQRRDQLLVPNLGAAGEPHDARRDVHFLDRRAAAQRVGDARRERRGQRADAPFARVEEAGVVPQPLDLQPERAAHDLLEARPRHRPADPLRGHLVRLDAVQLRVVREQELLGDPLPERLARPRAERPRAPFRRRGARGGDEVEQAAGDDLRRQAVQVRLKGEVEQRAAGEDLRPALDGHQAVAEQRPDEGDRLLIAEMEVVPGVVERERADPPRAGQAARLALPLDDDDRGARSVPPQMQRRGETGQATAQNDDHRAPAASAARRRTSRRSSRATPRSSSHSQRISTL